MKPLEFLKRIKKKNHERIIQNFTRRINEIVSFEQTSTVLFA